MRAVWRQAGTGVSAHSLTSEGDCQCEAEISLYFLVSEDALAGGPKALTSEGTDGGIQSLSTLPDLGVKTEILANFPGLRGDCGWGAKTWYTP